MARINATVDRWDNWYSRFPYSRPKLVRTGKSPTKRPSSMLANSGHDRSIFPDDMTFQQLRNRRSF